MRFKDPSSPALLMGVKLAAALALAAPLIRAEEAKPADGTTGKAPFETPKAQPRDETQAAVQVTELGLMRTLVVFDEGMDNDLVKLVNQRLSDVHFRVFESSKRLGPGESGKETLRALGEKAHADLVLHASVQPREKKKLGEAHLFEAEATVEIVSPVNGELLVTHTGRADGVRKFDEVEARRSATEKALDAVVKEAATKALEKSDKIIVYEVEISKVPNNLHVLRIKDYIAKLKGVYHVRDLSCDPAKQLVVLEVIGSPKMLTFLKAHIEKMPRLSAQ